jgi:hypothetical protein
MIEYPGDIPLSPDFEAKSLSLIESNELNFSKLAHIAGLDPSRDFIGADLRDVDFSNCDLRGHDFSEADLRGCTGYNINWDITTIFKNTQLEGSIFHYYHLIERFPNPDMEIRYRKLRSDYWANICEWIGSNVVKKPAKEQKLMAMRLFFDIDDISVKTEIAIRMKRLFDDVEEYRLFLLNLIMRNPRETTTLRSALIAASNFLESDAYLYDILLKYAANNDSALNNIVVSSLIRSRLFRDNISKVKYILDVDSVRESRVLFLLRINEIFRYCPNHYLTIGNNIHIDYKKPLDENTLRILLSRIYDRDADTHIRNTDHIQYKIDRNNVRSIAKREIFRRICFLLRKFRTHNVSLLPTQDVIDRVYADIE